jgi:uncharacterized SAM-binding protein YcdF (DUF218 family)
MRPWQTFLMRGLFTLMILLTSWFWGLIWFVQTMPASSNAQEISHTDGLVVLTGGTGRLTEAIALLSAKHADRLFVTGVYRGVDVSELLRLSKKAPQELACCITLDYEADDTLENAVQTAAWVRRERLGSIRLVTSDYHLRRSLMEFHMAMPGVTIIPHAVTPPHLSMNEWWRSKKIFSLMAIEYSKYLIVGLRYALYVIELDTETIPGSPPDPSPDS